MLILHHWFRSKLNLKYGLANGWTLQRGGVGTGRVIMVNRLVSDEVAGARCSDFGVLNY